MAKLDDLRRRFPPDDAREHAAAYEEAACAERVGALVHDLRTAAGLDEDEVGARAGVDADEVLRVEEGDPALTLGTLRRVAGALGVRLVLRMGPHDVVLTDTGPGDSGPADSGPGDSGPADAGRTDPGAPDRAPVVPAPSRGPQDPQAWTS